MPSKKFIKIVLIASLALVLINLFLIDLDNLTDLKINLSKYLGVLSMSLNALAMLITLRKMNKEEQN
ncbi:hypothetical protein [Tenacibaculum sp. 190524A05c]|uniref:Uncharacterized protein n=1 Tax=Tenacibaculum platacis TaxID=3137852 RepID=A0ABM9P0I1_9FLAO